MGRSSYYKWLKDNSNIQTCIQQNPTTDEISGGPGGYDGIFIFSVMTRLIQNIRKKVEKKFIKTSRIRFYKLFNNAYINFDTSKKWLKHIHSHWRELKRP